MLKNVEVKIPAEVKTPEEQTQIRKHIDLVAYDAQSTKASLLELKDRLGHVLIQPSDENGAENEGVDNSHLSPLAMELRIIYLSAVDNDSIIVDILKRLDI
jgi:hypothetical protein